MDLVREFARNQSETAFAGLVQRHINMVYSVAFRFMGDGSDAQDVTQAVFIILARKAASLRDKTNLAGWLYETTRFTAMSSLRNSARRRNREQEAYMQSDLNEPDKDNAWQQFAPHLEAAMARLSAQDRALLALRYFSNKSGMETAALLGINEWAVHKRTSRALEKLRRFFSRRGLAFTTATIATAISVNSVQAAPTLLAKSVSTLAIAKGAAASGSTLTLIKGALKLMAWTKAKTAIVGGVVLLLAAGTTTVMVKEIQENRTYPWQVHEGNIENNQVDQPPQVRILASKFHTPDWATLNGKMIGTGVQAQNVVASAYGFVTPARAVFSAALPAGQYDYIACLAGGEEVNSLALQGEVKKKFGVVGKTEMREADVWVLKVKSPNSPGLIRNEKDQGNGLWPKGTGFHGWHESMSNLAYMLEAMSNVPVFDETGIAGSFDFDLNCQRADLENRNWDAVNDALNQLGLELVPDHRSIEMLIVEKAK